MTKLMWSLSLQTLGSVNCRMPVLHRYERLHCMCAQILCWSRGNSVSSQSLRELCCRDAVELNLSYRRCITSDHSCYSPIITRKQVAINFKSVSNVYNKVIQKSRSPFLTMKIKKKIVLLSVGSVRRDQRCAHSPYFSC